MKLDVRPGEEGGWQLTLLLANDAELAEVLKKLHSQPVLKPTKQVLNHRALLTRIVKEDVLAWWSPQDLLAEMILRGWQANRCQPGTLIRRWAKEEIAKGTLQERGTPRAREYRKVR